MKLLLEHKAQLPFESALIFLILEDTPLGEGNAVKRYFKLLLTQTGLPEAVRFYNPRYTHATLLLKAEVRPKIASERPGQSITLAPDTYRHVLPGTQDETAKQLDAMLFGTTKTTETPACDQPKPKKAAHLRHTPREKHSPY